MGQTCFRLQQVTALLKLTQSSLKQLQRRNIAQSCSSGCGTAAGGMPAGRAGWLCQPSPSLLRAVSLRRGQVLTHRVHLLRPPVVDSRVLTDQTGIATGILSVSQHPPLIRGVLRPSRAQQRPQLQLLMPSSRMGINLRQVMLSMIVLLSGIL